MRFYLTLLEILFIRSPTEYFCLSSSTILCYWFRWLGIKLPIKCPIYPDIRPMNYPNRILSADPEIWKFGIHQSERPYGKVVHPEIKQVAIHGSWIVIKRITDKHTNNQLVKSASWRICSKAVERKIRFTCMLHLIAIRLRSSRFLWHKERHALKHIINLCLYD